MPQSDMKSNRIIEIESVETRAFKSLFDPLKEIIPDANLICTSEGIKIATTDISKTMFIHMKLDASKFKKYYVKHKKVVGIKMHLFYDRIRNMTDNDTLTLFLDESENDEERLGIEIANGDVNKVSRCYLKLMDIDEVKIDFPPVSFNSIITMRSDEFQRICRDMLNISDVIEIKNIGKQLLFKCDNDMTEQTVIMGEVDSGLCFQKINSDNEIIQGYYDLKTLTLFTKCTAISNTLEIYFKNDFPLIIQFKIGSFGILKVALAPKSID